jgi:hypothetical protein
MIKSTSAIVRKPDEEARGSKPATRPYLFKIALFAGTGTLIIVCILVAVVLSQNKDVSSPIGGLQPILPQAHSSGPVGVESLHSVSMFTETPFYSLALRAKAQPRLFIGLGLGTDM